MRAQTVAGWVALVAGLALVLGLLVTAFAPGVNGAAGVPWPMCSSSPDSRHYGRGAGSR